MTDRNSRLEQLYDALKKRIVILDGGMGTEIQNLQLDESQYRGERFKDYDREVKGNNDLLCLSQPELLWDIHQQYLDAGADIIETNTFNSTRVSQSDYGILWKPPTYAVTLPPLRLNQKTLIYCCSTI